MMTNHFTFWLPEPQRGLLCVERHADLPKVAGVPNPDFLPQMSFDNPYTQLGSNNPPDSSQTKTTRGTYALNDVLTRVIGKAHAEGGL